MLALAQMLSGPLVQTIISELAPRTAQATYQAAFGVVNDLKDAAGPAIGTWLFALAAALPWVAGIMVSIAASFGLVAWRGNMRRSRSLNRHRRRRQKAPSARGADAPGASASAVIY
jgi:MFS family permease